MLQKVRDFADRCHGDQLRKYVSDRYIVHPVRVMEMCRLYTDDLSSLAAALLHDVLEDTRTSAEEIKQFLLTVMQEAQANKTVKLVSELTDVFTKQSYPQWNRRVRKDKEALRLSKVSTEAQTIKYADIIDNAPEIVAMDADFAKRFIPEYRALLKKMDKGDPKLYTRARHTIDECMQRVSKTFK